MTDATEPKTDETKAHDQDVERMAKAGQQPAVRWGHQPMVGLMGQPGRQDDAHSHAIPVVTSTVCLLGPACSGKSTLAQAIIDRHGWSYLSIDALNGDWPRLKRTLLATTTHTVVETIAYPPSYRRLAKARGAIVVCLTIPEALRQQRLDQREHAGLRKVYRAPSRYDYRADADRVIDGSQPIPAETVDQLVAMAHARTPTWADTMGLLLKPRHTHTPRGASHR